MGHSGGTCGTSSVGAGHLRRPEEGMRRRMAAGRTSVGVAGVRAVGVPVARVAAAPGVAAVAVGIAGSPRRRPVVAVAPWAEARAGVECARLPRRRPVEARVGSAGWAARACAVASAAWVGPADPDAAAASSAHRGGRDRHDRPVDAGPAAVWSPHRLCLSAPARCASAHPRVAPQRTRTLRHVTHPSSFSYSETSTGSRR